MVVRTCCLAAVCDMGGYNPDTKSSTLGEIELNLSAKASNSLMSLSLVVEPCVLIQTVIFFKPFLATCKKKVKFLKMLGIGSQFPNVFFKLNLLKDSSDPPPPSAILTEKT